MNFKGKNDALRLTRNEDASRIACGAWVIADQHHETNTEKLKTCLLLV